MADESVERLTLHKGNPRTVGMKRLVVSLLSAVLAAGAFAAPERFLRSTPETQGIDSQRLLACVEALATEIDGVHSFMLLRHGKVVAEGWWKPYAAEHNHVLFSLSKSFASTAIGIAAAEGKLSSDDPVLKFFPDQAPKDPSRQLTQMRVRDLLSMTTGHETPPSAEADTVTVKSFLATEVPHQPGTFFRYNTAASFMLSAIVEKQTGEKLVDYLKPRLFDPLGIENPVWEENSEGIALGGYGLRVRTEDIAALGQLYLQEGEWKGRRLLTKDWVRAATSKQVSNGSNPKNDWSQGYGYQFWRCRHGAYRGDGAFGQFCVVLPEQDAVVAITSGYGDMAKIMNILWDKLLPAFHYVPLPDNEEGVAALDEKLDSLVLPVPKGEPGASQWQHVSGNTYRFPRNESKIESVKLVADAKGRVTMTLRADGADTIVPGGFGKWIYLKNRKEKDAEPTAGSYAWTERNVLTIESCAYETPFVTTYTLKFEGRGRLELRQKVNVGFGGGKEVTLKGKVQSR